MKYLAVKLSSSFCGKKSTTSNVLGAEVSPQVDYHLCYKNALYTTNFTEPLSYQDSAFLKLPKFP